MSTHQLGGSHGRLDLPLLLLHLPAHDSGILLQGRVIYDDLCMIYEIERWLLVCIWCGVAVGGTREKD